MKEREEWDRTVVFMKEVHCCRECPNCVRGVCEPPKCSKIFVPMAGLKVRRNITNMEGIPDWCPLLEDEQDKEVEE